MLIGIANRSEPFGLCKKRYLYERTKPTAAAPHPKVRPRHKGSIGQSRHYGRVPLASGLHPTPDISLRRNNALCHQRKSRGYWITRRRERPSCGNCAHNFSLGKTPSNRLKSNGIWSTEIRTTLAATGLTIRFSLGLAAILASGLRITPAFLESRRADLNPARRLCSFSGSLRPGSARPARAKHRAAMYLRALPTHRPAFVAPP